MKPITKKISSITLLLFLMAWLVYYIKNNFHDFKQLSLVNPEYILYFIIINLILSLTNGLVIKYLLEPFKVRLAFKEWFGLSVITTFYNMILPFRGGAIVRASYLKKKHGFSYTHFFSTLFGIYIINVMIASLMGIISVILIFIKFNIFSPLMLMIFLIFFVPTFLIIIFSPNIPKKRNNLINNLIKVINGWHLIRKNNRLVAMISIIMIVQLFFGLLNTVLIYGVFDVHIGFIKSMFLVSISYLGNFISIMPGALGVSEAAQVFSALIIDITPAQSIMAVALGRVISILTLFFLGPIFSYILLKRLSVIKG